MLFTAWLAVSEVFVGSWACVGISLCGVCCMGSIVTGVKQGVSRVEERTGMKQSRYMVDQ
jgi:hypothetical protein